MGLDPITGGAIIGGVGALGSALIGGHAASSAADTQAQAAQQSAQVAQNIYNQQAAVNQPYVQAGVTGQNRLMELLGLGANTGAQGYGSLANANFTADQFNANQDPGYA